MIQEYRKKSAEALGFTEEINKNYPRNHKLYKRYY